MINITYNVDKELVLQNKLLLCYVFLEYLNLKHEISMLIRIWVNLLKLKTCCDVV